MKKTLGIITAQWHSSVRSARLNGSHEMLDTMVFAKGGDSDLRSVGTGVKGRLRGCEACSSMNRDHDRFRSLSWTGITRNPARSGDPPFCSKGIPVGLPARANPIGTRSEALDCLCWLREVPRRNGTADRRMGFGKVPSENPGNAGQSPARRHCRDFFPFR